MTAHGLDVSIVVPTLNRSAGLRAALEGLTRLEAPGIAYEIIVVDNGSDDETRAVVERAAAVCSQKCLVEERVQRLAEAIDRHSRDAESGIPQLEDGSNGHAAEYRLAERLAGRPAAASVAAPGAAGIPVTHRGYASAFAVVTGHECDGASDLDWSALARMPALVVLMGLRALPEIVKRLTAHGMSPETAAAVVANATLPDQRTVVGTLATIADDVREAGLEPPATLVVGEVVRLHEALPTSLGASAARA